MGPMTSRTEEKWRNTGFYSLGVDYKATDKWTVRSGVGYDMSVIRSAAYRTPRIPDGRRVWASLGTSYAFRNMQVDVGYSHIFVYGGHAKGTDNANRNPNIKYSSSEYFQADYKLEMTMLWNRYTREIHIGQIDGTMDSEFPRLPEDFVVLDLKSDSRYGRLLYHGNELVYNIDSIVFLANDAHNLSILCNNNKDEIHIIHFCHYLPFNI